MVHRSAASMSALAALLLAALVALCCLGHAAARTSIRSAAGVDVRSPNGTPVELRLVEYISTVNGVSRIAELYLDLNIRRVDSAGVLTERLIVDAATPPSTSAFSIPSYTDAPLTYTISTSLNVRAVGRYVLLDVPPAEGEPTPTGDPFAVRVQFSWQQVGQRRLSSHKRIKSEFVDVLDPSSSNVDDRTSTRAEYHAPAGSPRLVVTQISPPKVLFNETIACGTNILADIGTGCGFELENEVTELP